MRSRRLIWRIYLSYLLLIFGTLIAVTWYISVSVRNLYVEQTEAELQALAFVMSDQILRALTTSTPAAVDSVCDALGKPTNTRITVIKRSGKVIADTHENPAVMDNHSDRPEIIKAFKGELGSSVRFSHTIGEEMMYFATPLKYQDSVIACLRAAIPLTAIDDALAAIRMKIVLGSVGAALLAALVGLWVSRKLTQPLDTLRRGVDRFARGEFHEKVRATGTFEVEELSAAINHMAEQLDSKIAEITDQRAESDAILGSMVEGVLAVDNAEQILSINKAAARWFQIGSEDAVGRTLQETVRNPELLRFVTETLKSSETTEHEFIHSGAKERILQARGARLLNTNHDAIGAVVVMSNITQLKKLDRMRRDFVANVSHELKTPITSIKGFVETLQTDGSLPKEDRDRFLDIIARQSERLNTIIDDLLTLSSLEQGDKPAETKFAVTELRKVIQSAISLCSQKAKKSRITLIVECPEDITASINSQLFEQALVNLIDNAIKYSGPESDVVISCYHDELGHVVISVTDQGLGIEPKHLPRIFERFYRADKARSRQQGGTGLGLAIVKHITQLHGGQAFVSSRHGEGSVFSIVLESTRKSSV